MLKRAAEAIGEASGLAGSGIAAACCLGVPAVLAGVGAVGLGFIVRDAYLFPLFVGFLGLSLWLAHRKARRHGDLRPFRLALAGGLVATIFLWLLVTAILPTAIGLYVGLAALVGGEIWSLVVARRARACRRDAAPAPAAPAPAKAPPDLARRAAIGAGIAIAAGAIFYGLYKSVEALAPSAQAGEIACWGVNACKGQGACATAFNACAGQNQCKGKGFLYLPEKECYAQGGVPLAGSEADPAKS